MNDIERAMTILRDGDWWDYLHFETPDGEGVYDEFNLALDIAIDALQSQLDRERKLNGWISVEDRLPSEDDVNSPELGVLAIHKVSKRRYYHYRSVVDNSFDFTHWMPLPQPPREGRV